MSHELQKHDTMFSVGRSPWHRLGTVLPENRVLTSAEALQLAGLAWTVELVPLQTVPTDGRASQAVPHTLGVLRSDTGDVLGTVGRHFAPLQNADAFAAFDRWVPTLLQYQTAGSLRNGARVWILARLQVADLDVGSDDRLLPYVLLSHGHDGSLALRVQPVCVRVECNNTLRAARLCTISRVCVQHRGDVATHAELAMAQMPGIRAACEKQAEHWRTLTTAPADLDDVARLLAATLRQPLRELLGGKRADGSSISPSRLLEPCASAFEDPRGRKLATQDGTWWGVYQAITEVLTHGTPDSRRDRSRKLDSISFGTSASQLERADLCAEILARRDARWTADVLAELATPSLIDLSASLRAA